MEARKPEISGNMLKYIALVTMFIDHFGAVVVERLIYTPEFNYDFWYSIDMVLRYIGRLAFPIFCFLLVEGFLHTSNVKKYFFRLLLFAVIAEIPFNLGISGKLSDWNYQNVFWELVTGILTMICLKLLEKQKWNRFFSTIGCLLIVLLFAFLTEALNFDYGMYGIISIALIYIFRYNRIFQLLVGAVSFCWEPVAPLAFLIISCYNGKRGKGLKYVFYVFYPAHLLLLYLIARIIGCRY